MSRLPRVVAALTLLAACGGAAAEQPAGPAAVAPGSVPPRDARDERGPADDPVEAEERIPTPVLPFAMESASPEMKRAWEAAVAAYALPRAEQPADDSPETLDAWASDVLGPWAERRREAIQRARLLLVEVPRHDAAEQVVARAALGLLWEDFARDFAEGVIVPPRVADDPELRSTFLETVHEQMAPVRERAMGLLEQCRTRAEEAGGILQEWATFCADRRDAIRAWHDGAPLEPTSLTGSAGTRP